MLRNHVRIPHIKRTHKHQLGSSLPSLRQALDRIEHLHCSFEIHGLRPLCPTRNSRRRREDNDVRIGVLEGLSKVGDGRVFDGQDERFDVG